jgi:predicted GH43/DUF377 family glycosyl hydrolase
MLGEEIVLAGTSRVELLVQRILALPEPEVVSTLEDILASFAPRHGRFEETLEQDFEVAVSYIAPGTPLSRERRLLIGAYLTHEFSVEAAALCNPSMVLGPDQSELPPGHCRFVMSLRAIGEGHTSSIEFRAGTIGCEGEVTLDSVGPLLVGGRRTRPSSYDKCVFRNKLAELGAANDIASKVLSHLGDRFTPDELERALAVLQEDSAPPAIRAETAKIIRVLAASTYTTTFPDDSDLSERVIFPAGPNETRGMEDARFVRFVEDDGSVMYYATYTAFDGFEILPQLIATKDFTSFAISTVNGSAAQNKGMALFPRRLDGKYVMLSRKDRENLYLTTSDDVHFWTGATEVHTPTRAWDLQQVGNCGSPIETDEGWLVLTHGAGPMRRYVLSALLLDLEDPRRVIGRLPFPLLAPDETERDGYVPNVVYSCGSLLHGETLVVPYGVADQGVCIATVVLADLIAELRRSGA